MDFATRVTRSSRASSSRRDPRDVIDTLQSLLGSHLAREHFNYPTNSRPTVDWGVSISWLSSAQGQEVTLLARAYSEPLDAITSLRKQFGHLDPNLISQALSQAQLQLRLESRWNQSASHLLLTDDGISQATRPEVARFRAALIVRKFGPNAHVLDMTCGLGFDARAFGEAGLRVSAIEIDPDVAAMANHNLASFGITVEVADATSFEIPTDVDVIFVDPARRDPKAPKNVQGQTKRIFNPQQWSPSWDSIADISSRYPVFAKVAPGIDKDFIGTWDATWISSDGDLVECLIDSTGTAQRTAVVISSKTNQSLSIIGGEQTKTEPLGKFLVIPDAALIRASALTQIANEISGGLVNEHIAWLTSDNNSAVGNFAANEPALGIVLEIKKHIKYSDKALVESVKGLAVAGVTIMTRGMQLDVEAIRKSLVKVKSAGSDELVVAIYRDDAGPQALICRRYLSADKS